jgi:hypothetical protein
MQYADKRLENFKFTAYKFSANQKTPSGINIDTSGVDVDLVYIDEQTRALEECLGIEIKRCAVQVKIAPDWQADPSGQWFPCKAVPSGMCAGINQYPSLIVVPPSAAAYRHELIHLVTRKDHGDPVYKRCDGH